MNTQLPRRAVVLLSGGLDSATTLAIARSEGFECFCLSLDYGQRHRVELDAAANVARALRAKEHRIVQLGLDTFGDVTAGLDGGEVSQAQAIRNVVAEGRLADEVGVDAFGLGEPRGFVGGNAGTHYL